MVGLLYIILYYLHNIFLLLPFLYGTHSITEPEQVSQARVYSFNKYFISTFVRQQSQPGFTSEQSCLHLAVKSHLKPPSSYKYILLLRNKGLGVTPSSSIKPFFIDTLSVSRAIFFSKSNTHSTHWGVFVQCACKYLLVYY